MFVHKCWELTQKGIKEIKYSSKVQIPVKWQSPVFPLTCVLRVLRVTGDPSGQPEAAAIVHPVKITADGGFLSHSVSHRVRRDLRPLAAAADGQVYYRVNYQGRPLTFRLAGNPHLVSSGYILEARNGSAVRTESRRPGSDSCHLLGTVEAPGVQGTAAISTCTGLVSRNYTNTVCAKMNNLDKVMDQH